MYRGGERQRRPPHTFFVKKRSKTALFPISPQSLYRHHHQSKKWEEKTTHPFMQLAAACSAATPPSPLLPEKICIVDITQNPIGVFSSRFCPLTNGECDWFYMDKWEGNKWVRVLHIVHTVTTIYSGYQKMHLFMKNFLIIPFFRLTVWLRVWQEKSWTWFTGNNKPLHSYVKQFVVKSIRRCCNGSWISIIFTTTAAASTAATDRQVPAPGKEYMLGRLIIGTTTHF